MTARELELRDVREATILLVDDEVANLELLEGFLADDGYERVVTTRDPRQVLSLWEALRPDLLLLDLHMPHLDGFVVLEQLRAVTPREEYLPILVLTADVTPEAKLRALAGGASDFLTKPLDAVEVLLRIRNLLEARQLHLQQRAARRRAEAAEQRAAFLADASRVLSSSFDYRTMLCTVARLAVPTLADYCVVDLSTADDGIERVALAHGDAEREAWLRDAVDLWGGAIPSGHPLIHRVMGGEFVLVDDLPAALGEGAAEHPSLRLLAPRAVLSVPLLSVDRVRGALTFVGVEPGRSFSAEDVSLAEELGRRAMLAMENGQLYYEALQATRARDEILGVVAHDLRNPLSTVRMAAEMLLEEASPAQQKRVETIQRAAGRMHELIQDLLEVTRIEGGKLALNLRPESVRVVLLEARTMLEPLAAARSLTLETELSGDLPAVPLDGARILRVVSNLVGNAIKFTPEGGTIVLAATCDPLEVRVSVSDTGPGIPADQIPRIFGRFWQASRGDQRGVGLGLSIARGIVEAHGGRIWVESVEGVGSTFHFTLPRTREEVAREADQLTVELSAPLSVDVGEAPVP